MVHVVLMQVLHSFGYVQGEMNPHGPGEVVLALNQLFQCTSINILRREREQIQEV